MVAPVRKIPFNCLHCGKASETYPSKPNRVFCSRLCYQEYQRTHHTTEITCIICGKTFPQQTARAKEQVTCRSEECIQALFAMGEHRHNYGQRKYTFTCPGCEKPFTTSKKSQKYCSRPCRYNHTHVQKVCIICGKPFEVGTHHADVIVTCRSKECKKAIKLGKHNYFYGKQHSETAKKKISEANRKEYIKVECTCGCGEKFELPVYRIRKNKTNMFFVDRTHLDKWLIGENHWNYRGGNIYYGDGWERVARAVRERDKVCQECGKTPEENGRALDVHHKIPARISRDNSMDNLIALCMSCHHRINVLEQYEYPIKVNKYRKCLVCGKVFTPAPFQMSCSAECKRKRIRGYEKKYLDTHPEAYQARRQRIKNWQQANNDRVNSSHQRSRLQRRLKSQTQEGPGLFD